MHKASKVDRLYTQGGGEIAEGNVQSTTAAKVLACIAFYIFRQVVFTVESLHGIIEHCWPVGGNRVLRSNFGLKMITPDVA